MSSGRKSIRSYYSKVAPQTILRARFFDRARGQRRMAQGARHDAVTWPSASWGLSAAKLAALRRTALGARGTASSARAFVLVSEDQSAFFQIVRRHLDRYPVARQGLDPVFLHLACGIGNDLVPCVELDAVAGIGEDFGDQSFELDQLFFSHGYLQVDRRLAWPTSAVGLGVRTAFTVEKGDALQSFGLTATLRGAARLLPIDLVVPGCF